MNKYTVTFEKSNEDIPTLIVARENLFAIVPSIDIIRVITGPEAEKLWSELSGKAESRKE